MKKSAALLCCFALGFSLCFGVSAAVLEKEDQRMNIKNDVRFAYTVEDGTEVDSEDTENQVRIISFVNMNADTSYFMVDDLNNSDWVKDKNIKVLAVDVTGADDEVISMYREVVDSAAVSLVSDAETTETALAFAEKSGLEKEGLSYPFTVILDQEGNIRYAMEGYRAPDALSKDVETIIERSFSPRLFAYGWDDGVRISWQKDEKSGGYSLLRSEKKKGTYEEVYSTESESAVSYTDAGVSVGKTYYYKLLPQDSTMKVEKAEPTSVTWSPRSSGIWKR